MEAGFIALSVLALIAGVLIGIFIKLPNKGTRAIGIIHADYSDPEDGPYLFLELKVSVSEIVSKKRVVLDVDVTKFNSHE